MMQDKIMKPHHVLQSDTIFVVYFPLDDQYAVVHEDYTRYPEGLSTFDIRNMAANDKNLPFIQCWYDNQIYDCEIIHVCKEEEEDHANEVLRRIRRYQSEKKSSVNSIKSFIPRIKLGRNKFTPIQVKANISFMYNLWQTLSNLSVLVF